VRFSIALALMSASLSCAQGVTRNARTFYYSANKGTVMILDDAGAYIGANPEQPSYLTNPEASELLTPLIKPLFSGGQCIAYRHFTFAKLDEMRVGSTYECNGVRFRVIACTQEGSTCRNSEIEASCHNFYDGRCHSSSTDQRSEPAYTFQYDRRIGIMSVDFAPAEAGHPAVLRLVGPRGFMLQ
jgi:hypothetical protein